MPKKKWSKPPAAKRTKPSSHNMKQNGDTNNNTNCPANSNAKSTLPENASEWLIKSVKRWNLLPPYSVHTDNAWLKYYQERSALEWRHASVWQEDGEEASKEKYPSKIYDKEKLPNPWNLDWSMPNLKPHCAESYAVDLRTTTKERYSKYLMHIRERVQTTLASCQSLPTGTAQTSSEGIYILQYWANFEDVDSVRTCHFETRFYVPVGSGDSFDIHFRFHFRARSFGDEQFSDLYTRCRSIEEVEPTDPTPVGEWYPTMCGRSKALNNSMIKLMDEYGKKVARLANSKELKFIIDKLFSNTSSKVSARKAWCLMARAGGLCVTGDRSGCHFNKARKKFGRLWKGEESDGEENDDGPSGCDIM